MTNAAFSIRATGLGALAVLLGACQSTPQTPDQTLIRKTLTPTAVTRSPVSLPGEVNQALLPPLQSVAPRPAAPRERFPRFDLTFQNAPADQVFMGLAYGTNYSVVVSPDVKGTLTLNLHHVTMPEALAAIRDAYGYEYDVEGKRIIIKPAHLETRIFKINYLDIKRRGVSDLSVNANDINTGAASQPGVAGGPVPGTGTGLDSQALQSTRVHTTSDTDFWKSIRDALDTIVGHKDGRQVVVNAQSGVVVVRAMPQELRDIARFLRATQGSIERQVILEAKILEVQLNKGFQSGINWQAMSRIGNNDITTNQIGGPGLFSSPDGTAPTVGNAGNLGGTLPILDNVQAFGGVFNMVLKTANFSAFIEALSRQGNVRVLSSPRIATINNQKAVIKVGTDNIYVTNINTTNTAGAGGLGSTVNSLPTPTLTPLFSGIALDVTPSIDANGTITLHIHPSITDINTVTQNFTINGASYSLPLASSDVREVDSIVRARNGQLVVIGGLMKESQTENLAYTPLLGDIPFLGAAFRNTKQAKVKSELVILLRPVVVNDDEVWNDDIRKTRRRFEDANPGFHLGGFPRTFGVGGER